jgi:hypothetical protein
MAEIERNIKPDATQIAEGADVLPAVHGYNGVVNTSFPVSAEHLWVILAPNLLWCQTPMRIPLGQKLYKEAVPLAFPGLTVTGDLSNRTNVVSASTYVTTTSIYCFILIEGVLDPGLSGTTRNLTLTADHLPHGLYSTPSLSSAIRSQFSRDITLQTLFLTVKLQLVFSSATRLSAATRSILSRPTRRFSSLLVR